MSEGARLFQELQAKFSAELHTLVLATVLSYDSTLLKASVQPLASKNGISYPVINNIPLSYIGSGDWIIHAPLKIGDIVCVSLAEHDIDNILGGRAETNVNTDRCHTLDDAVIVGVVSPFTEPQSMSSDDLYIGTKDGLVSITLKPGGIIEIEAGTIKLGAGATEAVALGDSLKSWLDNHKHTGRDGDPQLSSTVSPNPSTKVVVE